MLGIKRSAIVAQQHLLYSQFAKKNKPLTLKTMKSIEYEAMVNAGMPSNFASYAIKASTKQLINWGWKKEILNIPWHGKEIFIENSRKQINDEVLDILGRKVVEDVRDLALEYAIQDLTALRFLNPEQKEIINQLISETIRNTIFEFLNIFEDSKKVKLAIFKDEQEYDYIKISGKVGSEATFLDGTDGITKFSKHKK